MAQKETTVVNAAMLCLFTRGLVMLSYIDLRYHRLPDHLTLSLLWLGLLFNIYDGTLTSDQAILGAVWGYLLLWGLYWSFWLMTKKEGVGYGDLKLLAAIGAWGGANIIVATLFTAALLSSLVCLPLLTRRREDPQAAVFAFGPFLALAGWGYVFMQL